MCTAGDALRPRQRRGGGAALTDPLVMDAALFEGGGFAEFLAVRGPLLPDDERTLAEQWLLVERSVFEVEQVHPGRAVAVRDVRTGDRHQVTERMASHQLQPGHLVCARVVPAGDALSFFGLEPVALHERDPLIELLDTEPEPEDVVAAEPPVCAAGVDQHRRRADGDVSGHRAHRRHHTHRGRPR